MMCGGSDVGWCPAGVGAFWEGWEGGCSGAWLKIQSRSVNSCRACYTCRGLMQRAETPRKRVWQDPIWFHCSSGVWDNKRISPHAAYGAPSKSPPTYRGHNVWFLHCFLGFSAPPCFYAWNLKTANLGPFTSGESGSECWKKVKRRL